MITHAKFCLIKDIPVARKDLILQSIIPLLISSMLIGCGGGSSSVTPNNPTPPDPTSTSVPIPVPMPPLTPDCITTIDECLTPLEYQQQVTGLLATYNTHPAYDAQWWLATVRADQAYANLALAKGTSEQPGSRINVAVIDTGIDQDHPIFAGQIINETLLGRATDETGDSFSHGTAVSGLIAGRRTEDQNLLAGSIHGIAWGAAIHMYAIPLGSGSTAPYSPITVRDLNASDATFANIFNTVLGSNPDILNLSFGVEGLIDHYTETELRNNLRRTIAALAQAGDTDKTIIVRAAGNQHGRLCVPGTDNCAGNDRTDGNGNPAGTLIASSSAIFSGLPMKIAELRGHHLAVVAIRQDDKKIANFSNRCGSAADWCLAAPGENIRIAFFGSDGRGVGVARGTSFSAPIVSGGLALMKQLFREQLSSEELVTRLLATANKNGIYADRSIYGQGLLDLGAATAPVGPLMLSNGSNINIKDSAINLQSSQLQLGYAFGYKLLNTLNDQQIVAFDSLGAPFWFDLKDFIRQRATNISLLDKQMRSFLSFESNRPLQDKMTGHLTLADHATKLTWQMAEQLTASVFATDDTDSTDTKLGTMATWHMLELPLSLRSGWLLERETLLGGYAEGAFGKFSGTLNFIGFSSEWSLGKWQLFADAEIGITVPDIRPGLITDVSNLVTSAFSLQISGALTEYSALHISLAQPVKIERGHTTLSFPIGRTRQGDILHQPITTNLAPTGRQIDTSIAWHRTFNNGEFRLGTSWTYQAEHDTNAKSSLNLLVGWRSWF